MATLYCVAPTTGFSTLGYVFTAAGTTVTSLYVKESGSGTTGWVAK